MQFDFLSFLSMLRSNTLPKREVEQKGRLKETFEKNLPVFFQETG